MANGAPGRIPAGLLQALDHSDCAWLMTDAQGHASASNAGFARLLGYGLEDLAGIRPLSLLLGLPPQAPHPPYIQEALASQGRFTGEAQVRRRDGRRMAVALTISTTHGRPQDPEAPVGEIFAFIDIGFTQQFEALQKQALEGMVQELPLATLLHRMCLAVEQIAPDLVASVLRVDDGRLYPLAAPSLPPHLSALVEGMAIGPDVGSCGTAAYLGMPVVSPSIAADPRWASVREPFVQAGLLACWSSPIKNHHGQVIGTFAFYFRQPRSPNALHHRLVETCLHLCTVAMEHETALQRIHQLAFYDTLTQLPNRASFHDQAEQALRAQPHQTAALLFIDLDRFKLINDSQGHAVGDSLLQEVAKRLRHSAAPHGLAGRLSSDEFALLLTPCTEAQAQRLASQLLHAIAQPFAIDGHVHTPHASIGLCLFPQDGGDIATLLRHADLAMYAAKHQGRQRWHRYTPQLGLYAQERLVMEHALRDALEQGSLSLHFQPQVFSHALERLHGVEALARWQHPEWGIVDPQRFVAVAEDAGMMPQFTHWLLGAACTQLSAWRSQGLPVPQVAINLSARNFHEPQFAERVSALLQRHGLRPQELVLEITESVMLDMNPVTQANLHTLCARGFRLSLDDFGTGYSSLSHLHRLPISELKLDRSFVQDLHVSRAAEALTRSVLSIARSLHMLVVAEGVETPEQGQWLQDQGCPVLQGYLICQPLPAAALEEWLQAMCPPLPNPAPA